METLIADLFQFPSAIGKLFQEGNKILGLNQSSIFLNFATFSSFPMIC